MNPERDSFKIGVGKLHPASLFSAAHGSLLQKMKTKQKKKKQKKTLVLKSRLNS